MCSVANLFGGFDVSKRKTIESRQARDMSAHQRDGDEDGPTNNPNWEEHDGHQAKEANVEVGI